MSMLMPTRRNRGLLSDFMFDPFDAFFNTPMPSASTPTLMRTDIKETESGFEMTIDLPGFKKEDVQAELKDGYLHIEAQTKSETEDKDANGTYVRKERFSGKCSRTFYVGEEIPLNLELYIRNGIQAQPTAYPEIGGLDNAVFRDYSAVNPEQRKFDRPYQRRATLDGASYTAVIFPTAFQAVATGKLTPTARENVAIADENNRRRRRMPSMFDDDFFDSFFG